MEIARRQAILTPDNRPRPARVHNPPPTPAPRPANSRWQILNVAAVCDVVVDAAEEGDACNGWVSWCCPVRRRESPHQPGCVRRALSHTDGRRVLTRTSPCPRATPAPGPHMSRGCPDRGHGRPVGAGRNRNQSARTTAEARKGDPLAGFGRLTRPGWAGSRATPTRPHRMYLTGLVAALSRYSRGPRRKKRDQIVANTIAPRMYVSTGTQDFVVPAPEAGHADCARKWPT